MTTNNPTNPNNTKCMNTQNPIFCSNAIAKMQAELLAALNAARSEPAIESPDVFADELASLVGARPVESDHAPVATYAGCPDAEIAVAVSGRQRLRGKHVYAPAWKSAEQLEQARAKRKRHRPAIVGAETPCGSHSRHDIPLPGARPIIVLPK